MASQDFTSFSTGNANATSVNAAAALPARTLSKLFAEVEGQPTRPAGQLSQLAGILLAATYPDIPHLEDVTLDGTHQVEIVKSAANLAYYIKHGDSKQAQCAFDDLMATIGLPEVAHKVAKKYQSERPFGLGARDTRRFNRIQKRIAKKLVSEAALLDVPTVG